MERDGKRIYVGVAYLKPEPVDPEKVKGTVTKRRDNWRGTRDFYKYAPAVRVGTIVRHDAHEPDVIPWPKSKI
ncbi:hypothetical protein ml_182 [Mollivirus sibericum]|uniref:hypothetical protein n=1 Tax=Mollivirus sibericum TaxID=1678078 RepID=UPI0006B2EF70|nr:hypothetical protein ml_182 [Mollivirus sibericum]ALD61984.1 hypothetical protein ml_182 [Mollivirus sibericum]